MNNKYTPIPDEFNKIKRLNELSVKPITEHFEFKGEEYERVVAWEVNIKSCDVNFVDDLVQFVMEKHGC